MNETLKGKIRYDLLQLENLNEKIEANDKQMPNNLINGFINGFICNLNGNKSNNNALPHPVLSVNNRSYYDFSTSLTIIEKQSILVKY